MGGGQNKTKNIMFTQVLVKKNVFSRLKYIINNPLKVRENVVSRTLGGVQPLYGYDAT